MKAKILFLFHTYNFFKAFISNLSLMFFLELTFPHLTFIPMFLKFGLMMSFIFYILRLLTEIIFFKYVFMNDSISIQSGILLKKEFSIKYSDITGANWSQPLFFRLFNTFKLTLFLPDTGDNKTLEIPIVTAKEQIHIDSFIYTDNALPLTKSGSNFTKAYKPVSIKKIIQSSFLTLNYFYIVTIFFSLSDILELFDVDLFLLTDRFLTNNIYLFSVLVLIFSIFASIIKQLISFYKFSLYDFDNFLEVSNGILKTSSTKIKKNSIKGLVICSSLGQTILRLSSVKAIVLNSDTIDDQIKVNYILPFENNSEIWGFVEKVLPNKIFCNPEYKANYFFVRITILFFLAAINLITVIYNSHLLVYSVLIIFNLVVLLITKLCLNHLILSKDNIVLFTGLFNRKTFLLDPEVLEWTYTLNITRQIKVIKIGVKLNKLKKFTFISWVSKENRLPY
ncbi:PH domain-containing protein [Enterococcus faecium]|uniref:PH domain-containing protein n=1 Tax=Enterococcus TaxID=1350 RepID=UPI001C8B1096|nr:MULTISPECIES: PH domain-containing protein [Enterococcus]MBX9119736.1 PH domain-containing protein [Enterococcus faecium]MBX9128091.1 PH domain-containing protein [Enterococcus casseliflavus]